jgi:hypothetical protein
MDADEPAAAEPAAEAAATEDLGVEGMDAAARLGLPVKTAEDEEKEKEDAELRDLKKQVLEEEKRKRAERFNMEVEEPEKKDEPWAPPDGVPWSLSVWTSNVGRPTPSTRRASAAASARWRGDSTPSTRCCPHERVGSMALRFHAIDNLAHRLIPTQVALQEAAT